MRIIIVISSLRGGGAERVTSLLANAWVDMGHRVCVATFASSAVDAYTLDPRATRVAMKLEGESQSRLEAIRSNWRRVAVLRRLFGIDGPDVVLGMTTSCSILCQLAATGMSIPVIAAERTYPPMFPLGAPWHLLRRFVYPRTAMVVAQTQRGAKWLAQQCRGSRTAVIPNPVRWPLPREEPILTVTNRLPAGRQVILALGRLDPSKGFDLLLDAFARIAPRHPTWDLAIVGEGPQRDALLDQAHALGIDERAHFPGHVGNVQDWYERADLFVLSSRFEGFPNALLEAMACGCPAVSFDCDTGPRELIDDGVNGTLVPPGEGAAGLAAAIDRLIGDPQRRHAFGLCADQIRQRLALSRVARQWEQLFEEIRLQPS